MIDLSSKRMMSKSFDEEMNVFIDCGFTNVKEEARNYLGCSVLGAECERYVQYEAIKALHPEARKEFTVKTPARVMRIFERGHVFEDMAAKWLINAGFCLETLDKRTGGQFEVEYCQGAVKGHCDGILTHYFGKENILPLPALWECKAIGSKWFKEVLKKKTRSVYPKYYAQCQLYMHGLRLERAMMNYINADTMELHFELISYEEKEAVNLIERTKRILAYTERGEYVPKGSISSSHMLCKFCEYNKICW